MLRAQAATEYMIISAVILIIALIVVGVLGGLSGIGGESKKHSIESEMMTEDVAVKSYSVNQSYASVKTKNNLPVNIEISKMSIDGVFCENFNTNLRIGGEKLITCESDNKFKDYSSRKKAPKIGFEYKDLETGAVYTTKEFSEDVLIDQNMILTVGEINFGEDFYGYYSDENVGSLNPNNMGETSVYTLGWIDGSLFVFASLERNTFLVSLSIDGVDYPLTFDSMSGAHSSVCANPFVTGDSYSISLNVSDSEPEAPPIPDIDWDYEGIMVASVADSSEIGFSSPDTYLGAFGSINPSSFNTLNYGLDYDFTIRALFWGEGYLNIGTDYAPGGYFPMYDVVAIDNNVFYFENGSSIDLAQNPFTDGEIYDVKIKVGELDQIS